MYLTLKDKTSNLNILYAEDDEELVGRVLGILKEFFKEVFVVGNGIDALEVFGKHKIDIVLSDVDMPHCNGLEVARRIRETDAKIPIIILSAFTDQEYLLEAIPLGLTNYLFKPFDKDKLLKTIKEALNRLEDSGAFNFVLDDDVYYNSSTKKIQANGKEVLLTLNEVALIELLLQRRGTIVSFEIIEAKLFAGRDMTEASIKNLLVRLRKKVGADTIQTLRGIGLCMGGEKIT